VRHCVVVILVLVLAAYARASAAPATRPADAREFFRESFDDADLPARGWYDGTRFRIVRDNPCAGAGCIEYEWPRARQATIAGSSTVRHALEPSDEAVVRFSLRLSKDFGWTKKNYHPHLVQILTTENDRFAGPAGRAVRRDTTARAARRGCRPR
jgi:hypothetical protein